MVINNANKYLDLKRKDRFYLGYVTQVRVFEHCVSTITSEGLQQQS
jgi:hypothetical protein